MVRSQHNTSTALEHLQSTGVTSQRLLSTAAAAAAVRRDADQVNQVHSHRHHNKHHSDYSDLPR